MNKQEPFVITISREVGSGGHTVGRILSEKLAVRYCDKQLLESLQKELNLSAQAIERLKAEKKNWLKDILGAVSPLNMLSPMPAARVMDLGQGYMRELHSEVTSDEIFAAEVQILQGFAQMGSCVIAGRSGFYVFANHPNSLHVLITASMPYRIDRIMKKQALSEKEAKDLIDRIDKGRETYIRRYAGVSRYDARNYNLTIKADGHSAEEMANLILSYM